MLWMLVKVFIVPSGLSTEVQSTGRRNLELVRPPTRSGRATSRIARVSIVMVVVVVMGYSFLFCAPQDDNS